MVPHFEKMLYDQALLARTYLHAWQQLGEARWRQVLDETITYVLRDLRQPEGGFSSAEDADSEGEEGRFYVWRSRRSKRCSAPTSRPGRSSGTASRSRATSRVRTSSHRPVRGDLERPPEIEEARRRLFEAREHRVRPGLDDKVLTEWNGLMLDALARGRRRHRANRLARCRDRQRRLPPRERPQRRRPLAAIVAARRRRAPPRVRG